MKNYSVYNLLNTNRDYEVYFASSAVNAVLMAYCANNDIYGYDVTEFIKNNRSNVVIGNKCVEFGNYSCLKD